jgi:hypothetical protein
LEPECSLPLEYSRITFATFFLPFIVLDNPSHLVEF